VRFESFDRFDVPTTGGSVHVRTGGPADPAAAVLLHGIPETGLMWRHAAPGLAEDRTVVATDLRGFGDSGGPPSTPDHSPMRRGASPPSRSR
jgi:haloacetate dehalogenase